jgi:hypothetical protein
MKDAKTAIAIQHKHITNTISLQKSLLLFDNVR